MRTYIASIEALERFKIDCKKNEDNLILGRCQLCLDALLFISPISCSDSFVKSDENCEKLKLPIVLSGDEYLLNLITKCSIIKIIFPCTVQFNGFIDLSLLQSCRSLELVGIPYQRLTGINALRKNLQSLVWNRGYEEHERGNYRIFESGEFVNDRTFKIDEIFWDQFGQWSKLSYLSFSRSSLIALNTSAMPDCVTSLNLSMNRISRFNNQTNSPTNLTKLCLDYNQLSEIPKLDSFTSKKLLHLSLRGNLIITVKELHKFLSLEYLDLSSNTISDIREFLTEIGQLNLTLKTLYIENNPVCCHKQFKQKCLFTLYKMTLFNGKKLNRSNDYDIDYSPLIIPNYGLTIAESIPVSSNSNNELDDSIQRFRKERIVMINDTDDENFETVQHIPSNDAIHVQIRNHISTKNYLFGDVSGSYGSFNNQLDLSHSSTNQQEELNHEKNKLLQKRKELGENWLLNNKNSLSFEVPEIRLPEVDELAKIEKVEVEVKTLIVEPEVVYHTNAFDDTSEWGLEDTQEEENVFLVESYDSWNNLTKAQLSNFQDSNILTQFLFIRFRSEDLLLFEKDCTSGKTLSTLDLKVLQSFQSLNDDSQNPIAIQILFDTSILSKRERIYRFVEDGQCLSFLDILSKREIYKNNIDTHGSEFNSSIQFSSTPFKDNTLWLYLCLRCGSKTHRIITDCPKCSSPLIVKDIGEMLESKLSTPIATTPTNEFMMDNSNESNYTFEVSTIDDSYFDADHIDHVLKLMTEVAIYELGKCENDSLKKESVKSVCNCLIFNFDIKLFSPALFVFSENFIFLFEKKNEKLSLCFYYPFIGPHQFVLSHLPDFMKNHAFWFQCISYNQNRKRDRKKDKKTNFFDINSSCIELIMFDDKSVGKAFLEYLFLSHRICYRKYELDNSSSEKNLSVIIIKPDIMSVIHDTVSSNNDSKIEAILDEQLTKIIDSALSNDKDKDKIINEPNFFFIKSFVLNQELKNQQIEQNKQNNDILKFEQNLLLLLCQENFVLCQLSGHFYAISNAITSGSSSSLTKLLRSNAKFDDHIELRLLMRDCLLNLLPTVYVCEEKNRIILKFRDENGTIMSFTNSFSGNERDTSGFDSPGKSSLTVYDFEIDFYSLHSMKRVLQLVQTVWERHFGVTLTLSNAKCETY